MSENHQVEATGVVGTVYTTPTGLSEADPYIHDVGWEQVSENRRIRREVKDFHTRIPYRVWNTGPSAGIYRLNNPEEGE